MTTTASLLLGNAFGFAKAIPLLGERVIETVREWVRRYRSRRELLALGERSLGDLRLTRCDAMSEANKPFWKK